MGAPFASPVGDAGIGQGRPSNLRKAFPLRHPAFVDGAKIGYFVRRGPPTHEPASRFLFAVRCNSEPRSLYAMPRVMFKQIEDIIGKHCHVGGEKFG
jgi:hypothetical protein